jgi:ribonuclease VapC
MVLDSSAVLAIFFKEPGWEELEEKIMRADLVVIGAPTLFEIAMVISREARGLVDLTDFLKRTRVDVVPFADEHHRAALNGFLRFGKGRHPARLNILDCMAYATAEVAGLPLLYVGDDFAKTDIEAA